MKAKPIIKQDIYNLTMEVERLTAKVDELECALYIQVRHDDADIRLPTLQAHEQLVKHKFPQGTFME